MCLCKLAMQSVEFLRNKTKYADIISTHAYYILSVISASSLQILSVLLQRQFVLFTGLGGWEFITPGMLLWLSYLQLFSLFLWYNANMTHGTMMHFVESKGKWAVHLSVCAGCIPSCCLTTQLYERTNPAGIPCLPFSSTPGLTLYE